MYCASTRLAPARYAARDLPHQRCVVEQPIDDDQLSRLDIGADRHSKLSQSLESVVAGHDCQGYSALVEGKLVDATPSATALWSTARTQLVALFARLDDVEVL